MVRLIARVVERGIVRYSPAGVPVLECRLEHRSIQREAGHDRTVEFEIGALALGDQAGLLESVGPGDEIVAEGFLAPARKASRTLLLHITRFRRATDAGIDPHSKTAGIAPA